MNAESSQLGIRSGKKRGKKAETDPHNEEDGKSSQLDDTCFLIILVYTRTHDNENCGKF